MTNEQELSKCVCGNESHFCYSSDVHWAECMSAGCHIHGPLRSTKEEALVDWNTLCAEIETGRALLKAIPKDWEIGQKTVYVKDTTVSDRKYLRLDLRPIAKKAPSENDLKRLLLKCYKILGEQYRGYATEPPIMDEIDTAISATKEGETDG